MAVIRAKDPACGKLALPGGFVDPGERAEETVRRECLEELGWQPETIHFLASFPNTYAYRSVVYHTCDLYFTAEASTLDESDLTCDPDEVAGVRWINPVLINPAELAFESTRNVIQQYAALLASQSHSPPNRRA